MDAGFLSTFGVLAFIGVWVLALKGLVSAIGPIFRYLKRRHTPAPAPAFRPYYSGSVRHSL